MIFTLLILFADTGIARANAEDALARTQFEVGGGKAFIIAAPPPAAGKPSVSYAPTVG